MSKIVYYERKNAELTPEEIKMLDEAEQVPITYDEDCPELSEDMIRYAARSELLQQQA